MREVLAKPCCKLAANLSCSGKLVALWSYMLVRSLKGFAKRLGKLLQEGGLQLQLAISGPVVRGTIALEPGTVGNSRLRTAPAFSARGSQSKSILISAHEWHMHPLSGAH